jgi:hypothetical protein
LASILDFYNRHSTGTRDLYPIDWDAAQANIHTPNVVENIRSKYNQFMEAEYQVDGAVSKCGTRSEAMKALDVAMHYNYNLWMAHYLSHLEQIETLSNIGDVTMMSKMEMAELFPYTTRYNSMQ